MRWYAQVLGSRRDRRCRSWLRDNCVSIVKMCALVRPSRPGDKSIAACGSALWCYQSSWRSGFLVNYVNNLQFCITRQILGRSRSPYIYTFIRGSCLYYCSFHRYCIPSIEFRVIARGYITCSVVQLEDKKVWRWRLALSSAALVLLWSKSNHISAGLKLLSTSSETPFSAQ